MAVDRDVVKRAGVRVEVGLNAEQVPVEMTWIADDVPGGAQETPVKAMLLSLFEKDTLETLKMDLWTVDMMTMEMDKFMYYTLRAMADTYFRATQNKELAADMQRFAQYFGERTEILPPSQ